MKGELPVYNISIDPKLASEDEHLGISQIACVKNPAIRSKGMAFSTSTKMRFEDNLKLRLAAPVLIPDMRIYRQDPDLGEYYVTFSKEIIQELVMDFVKSRNKNVFNLDHDESKQANSDMLESWFVETPETDKSVTVYNLDPLPEGSYFVVSQFWDKDYFKNEIIAKGRTGYSIEGFLGMKMEQIKKQIKQQKMTKKKFEEVTTATGDKIFVDGEIGVDSYVYCAMPSIQLIDNKKSEIRYPVYDSIIELEDGRILMLEDGKIVSIEQKEAAETEPVTEEPATTEDTPTTEPEMESKDKTKMADGDMPEEKPAEETPDVKEEDKKPADSKEEIMAVMKPVIDEMTAKIAEMLNMISELSAPAKEEMKKSEKLSEKFSKLSPIDTLSSFMLANKR